MPLNAPRARAHAPAILPRLLARAVLGVGIAAVITGSAYAHFWALRHDMADVALFVTVLGSLTLAGLAVLAAMLGRWKWTFTVASFCIATMILMSITALFY